jgi:uncharacterized protein YndB with AHSA1/START domain
MTKKLPVVKKGIGDETVKLATQKTWDEWYIILDSVHAQKLNHTEIARYLYLHHLENNGWWCQMIANRYEQVRGMKKKYQSADGFSVSISMTFAVSVTDIYEAWTNESMTKKWLKEKDLEITSITPNTSIRMLWNDKKTRVVVYFYEKSSVKTQVVVEHNKLAKESQVEEKKKYWKGKLEKLKLFTKVGI